MTSLGEGADSLSAQLVEMGFSKEQVSEAVKNATNLEAAINWIVSNEEKGDAPQESTVELVSQDGASESVAQAGDDTKANALKCNDCGKLLKDAHAAQIHAERSGHVNFGETTEQIKALTDEERKVKAAEMQVLIKQKQAEKAEIERKENIEKEKRRRVDGQSLAEIKQTMADKEMKEIAADRKRQKQLDQDAKQRVLDQIAHDKEMRKKNASGKASGPPAPEVFAPPTLVTPPPKQDYASCKLQIRLTNGSTLTNVFKAQESLAAVRLYVQLNRTDGDCNFALMVPFPRKVFSDADMDAPLDKLGLVPSSVIVVTKIA